MSNFRRFCLTFAQSGTTGVLIERITVSMIYHISPRSGLSDRVVLDLEIKGFPKQTYLCETQHSSASVRPIISAKKKKRPKQINQAHLKDNHRHLKLLIFITARGIQYLWQKITA